MKDYSVPENFSYKESYQNKVDWSAAQNITCVSCEITNDFAIVTMNDPKSYNSLSGPMCIQLKKTLEQVCLDPDVKAVILTGSDPAFSSGGGMELMQYAHRCLDNSEAGAIEMWRWIRYQFGSIARLLTQSDKITIAAVNGPAAGVGLAYAFACDLIFVSEKARLIPAFAKIGLLPEVGTSWFLTRRIGYNNAIEWFLSGQEMIGKQTCDAGIANQCFNHSQLLPAAKEWAEKIANMPDGLVAMAKPLLKRASDATWEQSISMEEFAEPICFTTLKHKMSVKSFFDHGN